MPCFQANLGKISNLRVSMCGSESCRIGWNRIGNKSSLLFSSLAVACRVFCSIHCKNQTSHSEAEAEPLAVWAEYKLPLTHGVTLHLCSYMWWQWFSMLLPGPLYSIPALISLSLKGFGAVSVQAPSHNFSWAFKLLCKLLCSLCEQCLMGLWFPILPFLTWRNTFQSWFSIPITGK